MTSILMTVFRTGGEYSLDHVVSLRRQLQQVAPDMKMVCLTDLDPDTIKLPFGTPYITFVRPATETLWPGWWMKMNLFHPVGDNFGTVLYLDLDSAIVGPLDDIREMKDPLVLRDFYRKGVGIGSGMMLITPQMRSLVWSGWMSGQPDRWMAHLDEKGLGDKCVLEQCEFQYKKFFFKRWQDVLPGQVISYKVHIRDKGLLAPPFQSRVVCFHGKPRPWEIKDEWIKLIESRKLPRASERMQ